MDGHLIYAIKRFVAPKLSRNLSAAALELRVDDGTVGIAMDA
ncbi:hypothetical protein [Endozoicomonas acroporae]|nr:hypothetical protein [Endozoicomonas acroporae]